MPLLEVSPGELADRQSILELKLRYACPAKRGAVLRQLDRVDAALEHAPLHLVATDVARLRQANERLWALEDQVRALLPGAQAETKDEFVRVAADIPRFNDLRAECKARIDAALGHAAPEIKIYAAPAGGDS